MFVFLEAVMGLPIGFIKLVDPKILESTMSAIDNKTGQEGAVEDFKDQIVKHPLSKFEYDLYHEEDDISMPVVRVKRVSMPNKGEKWKIFEENKVMFIIEGTKLNNKEKDFLRTIDGVNFLITQYKQGIRSFNALKNEIKKKLKSS